MPRGNSSQGRVLGRGAPHRKNILDIYRGSPSKVAVNCRSPTQACDETVCGQGRNHPNALEWPKPKTRRPNGGEGVQQQECSRVTGGNAEWKTVWRSLTKLNIPVPHMIQQSNLLVFTQKS